MNKIQTIEEFLTGAISSEDQLVFEAKQLMDRTLRNEVALQCETYRVIAAYNRTQLKAELDSLHQKLINDPSKKTFWDLVHSILQKN